MKHKTSAVSAHRTRKEGLRWKNLTTLHFMAQHQALTYMAMTELRAGGEVLEIDTNQILIKVECAGIVENVLFEGSSPEEMKTLFEFVHHFLRGIEEYGDLINEKVLADFEDLKKTKSGLLSTEIMPERVKAELRGTNRVKTAMLVACGVENEDHLRYCINAYSSIKELALRIKFSQDCRCPLIEVI